jgi:hypothetical protein
VKIFERLDKEHAANARRLADRLRIPTYMAAQLEGVRRGMSDAEIADALSVSVGTIKSRSYRMYGRLAGLGGVRPAERGVYRGSNRAAIAALAQKTLCELDLAVLLAEIRELGETDPPRAVATARLLEASLADAALAVPDRADPANAGEEVTA